MRPWSTAPAAGKANRTLPAIAICEELGAGDLALGDAQAVENAMNRIDIVNQRRAIGVTEAAVSWPHRAAV